MVGTLSDFFKTAFYFRFRGMSQCDIGKTDNGIHATSKTRTIIFVCPHLLFSAILHGRRIYRFLLIFSKTLFTTVIHPTRYTRFWE